MINKNRFVCSQLFSIFFCQHITNIIHGFDGRCKADNRIVCFIKKNNLYIHGRVDDVINVRGKRIGSEEIESIIAKIKNVYECCAVAIPEDLGGNTLYLFVAAKNKDLNDIISKKLVGNFGSFAIPKRIFYLTEMPKNKSGKILRRVLRTILENPNTKNYGDLSTVLNKKVIYEVQKKVLENEQ